MKMKFFDLASSLRKLAKVFENVDNVMTLDVAVTEAKIWLEKLCDIRAVDFDKKEMTLK